MNRPRTLLRYLLAGVLLAAATVTTGCAADRDRALVVLGPWTGDEAEPFVAALSDIERRTGFTIVYEGTRSLRETLMAELQTGSPPDVAIFNSPGEMVEYARREIIQPVNTEPEESVLPWSPPIETAREGSPHVYWVPVRVDLKSLVWTRKRHDQSVGAWCLGMASGGTSGWPGTDWIEDFLLQRYGSEVYEKWATGRLPWTSEEVTRAWKDWAELLMAKNGDKKHALRTSFSGLLNRKRNPCTHEHQGSFIRQYYHDQVRPFPSADFLGLTPREGNIYEVSGDMAAMVRPSADARKLILELTSPQTRATWVSEAGRENTPLFPSWSPPSRGPTLATRKVLDYFLGAKLLCLDASDAMPPTLRDAFYRAVLEFVSDPGDDTTRTALLAQLEAERLRQLRGRAFIDGRLCAIPPPTR